MPVRPTIKPALVIIASALLLGAAKRPVSHNDRFTVALTGGAETNLVHPSGGIGDPDGSGVVRLTIDQSRRQVCYDFNMSGLATPMMAHIHRGQPLQNGPTVVTLFTGLGGEMSNCVLWTNKQLSAIVADPSNYYVNVYTTEYPDGAIRGQLG